MLQVNDKVYGISDDNEIIELTITDIFENKVAGQNTYYFTSDDGSYEDIFYTKDLDIKGGIYFTTRELAMRSLRED